MKKVFFTPKYPDEPQKAMGYIEIDEELVKRINIRPMYKPSAYGGFTRVVGPDGAKFKAYLHNPNSYGSRRKKHFLVHSHGEVIKLLVQDKLTIESVLYFVRSWAEVDATVVTPSKRTISLSKEKAEAPSWVYFVFNKDSNAIKIGIAKNVKNRLRSLQTSSPAKLELLATIKRENSRTAKELEKFLHDKFSSFWITGEWFEAQYELMNYIEQQDKE